ncbi:MAG: hypothetical protein COU82_02195 [Candidatus Portnoybacteria bacterium CG10_big_fil_rev_8_21_14_0_10_38_18]|uniref:Uncharacterized protein n=1 Tax=Candidatus Portnoybacteria bacterium CG10_big_fil_rev_8_21_14_0_10_38_18 TaxID=1974813 RepID=A0A2M8KBV5_9BACT|nr:MAG: hypothetical protein COU82_02195 [Candidatus Portnoybacteria bacterium CG10_big_fil_rev_8_21_14_0_10_38_18]
MLILNSWQYRKEVKQAEREGRAKPVWFTKKVAVLFILLFIFYLLGVFCRSKLFDLEVSRILQK